MLLVVMLGLVRGAAAQQALPPASAARTSAIVEVPPPPPGAAAPAEAKPDHPAEPSAEHGEAHHAPECDFSTGEHSEEGRFFFDAEYLLLQPHRRGLDIAINDPINNGLPAGNIESVFPETDSGVRAGAGWNLCEHGWAVAAHYTYFYSASVRTVAAAPTGTLYATTTHPGVVDMVSSAFGDYRLKYQLFDLELGKNVEIGDDCVLWLSAGGRYAWIDQAFNVNYNGESAFADQVRSPINFDGGGIRVGGEGRWEIAHGFGIYASGYGSLLTGTFRTSLFESQNAGAAQITNISEKFRKVVPVAELGIGLTWHWENVHARIGYEMADWFGMVDSPDIVHDFSNKLSHRVSDLSLEGLAIRLAVGF
jgi:hypothetical protein